MKRVCMRLPGALLCSRSSADLTSQPADVQQKCHQPRIMNQDAKPSIDGSIFFERTSKSPRMNRMASDAGHLGAVKMYLDIFSILTALPGTFVSIPAYLFITVQGHGWETDQSSLRNACSSPAIQEGRSGIRRSPRQMMP